VIRALDMVNQVLRSANWAQTTGVTTIEGSRPPLVEKAVQAINHVGVALGQFAYWRWLHTRGTIITVAEYTTGTVAVTNGSKVVTGTSTVWETGMVGRTFHSSGYEELYQIAEISSPTSLRLTTEFNGTTATGKSYHIVENRYLLPEDFDSEVALLQFISPGNIRVHSPEVFDEIRFGPALGTHVTTSTLVTGDPQDATIETNENGRLILVLNPFSRYRRQLLFTYYRELLKFERDEDSWPFPGKLEHVIHDGALHYLSRDTKNDERSGIQLQSFFLARSELAGVTHRGDAYARFQPDTGLARLAQHRRRWTRRIRQGIEDERISP